MDSIDLRLTATINHGGRQLRATGERTGSAVLLYAGGTVDACNVAVWRRLLGQAARITWTPGPLIVDTSGLEFMGCCAFVALAEESARCQRRGIRLRLVSNRGITARVVAAGGLQAELPLYPSVGAALDDEHHCPAPITTTAAAAVARCTTPSDHYNNFYSTGTVRELRGPMKGENEVSDKDSGIEAGVKGVVEGVKGKAKEVAGAVTDNDSLIREGQAQQDKAEAQRDVAAKEAQAEKARAKASADEARERAEQ